MILTQVRFEALLQDLRAQQTESPTIDGKAGLSLETEGDRAYFIQHVAALANNVEPSHLIIGVEDRTWNPIGLPENSPLRNHDQTQHRMNQILANRLDPNLSVRYRTYEVSEVVYGLVAIEGTRAPYIIAIEDQRYGGDRTQAAPSHIYRGAIYVRRGANSVIANRQSEVLEIVNKAQQKAIDNAQPDKFLTEHNYLNTESENFGHHSLSDRLVEAHRKETAPGAEFLSAQSWVSFVFCPIDSGCGINPSALRDKLKPPDQCIWSGDEWYHWVPKPFIDMFYSARSTPKEFVGRWSPLRQNAEEITHFIHIRPSGHIEIGCTDCLFFQRDGVRCFAFVSLIGYLWQMVYLSRAIYHDAGYYGETAVLLNLVGTKGTRLADFAGGRRGKWGSPFSSMYSHSEQDVCQYLNIQIERGLLLTESLDDEIENMIREIAGELGNYYGQDRPRCFDFCTNEFPHEDYRRACGR